MYQQAVLVAEQLRTDHAYFVELASEHRNQLDAKIERLEQQLTTLREALKAYGQHKGPCEATRCAGGCYGEDWWQCHHDQRLRSCHKFDPFTCTCGFSALLPSSPVLREEKK